MYFMYFDAYEILLGIINADLILMCICIRHGHDTPQEKAYIMQ